MDVTHAHLDADKELSIVVRPLDWIISMSYFVRTLTVHSSSYKGALHCCC